MIFIQKKSIGGVMAKAIVVILINPTLKRGVSS